MTVEQYKQTMDIYFNGINPINPNNTITANIQNKEINEFYRVTKNPVITQTKEEGDLEIKLPSEVFFG
ncbi:hypothetical protein JXA48_03675 [Candidatus Woesearchaeota archaeon]|nr:hypothetical protein [Candidatus Woesearchaeota archaeon]